jgi:hypothetical protein
MGHNTVGEKQDDRFRDIDCWSSFIVAPQLTGATLAKKFHFYVPTLDRLINFE